MKACVFTVLQTKNPKYMFMPYDFARKHFNINDYEEKAVSLVVADGKTEKQMLNEIFEIGNNGYLKATNPEMRSISVSDVIKIAGNYYYVDAIGFEKIEVEA